MKIAIKGHPTRGKEVIKILESLGGINRCPLNGDSTNTYYYIDDDENRVIHCHNMRYVMEYCKTYTLEEFEKAFPFKIGDKVTIIGLPDFPKIITKMTWDCDEILYSFEGLNNTWFGTKSLKKFEMKEERNITLTFDKAKEWYKKGGVLREIALQAFTEEDLKYGNLPKTWEEFVARGNCIASWKYTLPKKYESLYKLEKLRDCWRQGWKPNWNDEKQAKYCICYFQGKFKISELYETRYFLSFPTMEIAEKFLMCFRDLIEQAGDLI